MHITTAETGVVKVFDAASLELALTLPLVKHTAESASYCAARRRIVTGGEDMWVHLYDCDTGGTNGKGACSCAPEVSRSGWTPVMTNSSVRKGRRDMWVHLYDCDTGGTNGRACLCAWEVS